MRKILTASVTLMYGALLRMSEVTKSKNNINNIAKQQVKLGKNIIKKYKYSSLHINTVKHRAT